MDCPNWFWSLCWILILIFLVWPFAWFLAYWYILFLPFQACVPGLKDVCDGLFKLINLVQYCAHNIRNSAPIPPKEQPNVTS